MKPMRYAQDIVPVGRFKGQAGRWLQRATETGRPVLITQHGRPAGILLSPLEFDRLQERQRFLESIAAGIADAEAGRTLSTAELRRSLAAHRGRQPRG